VDFALSPLERELYNAVTNYVRNEFNRADRLDSDRRRGNVGFAMTVLQRRLASSTAAIAASLTRRRERLENRLKAEPATATQPTEVDLDDLDEIDDLPEAEAEATTEQVVDEATAARTLEELRAEIELLKFLEALAERVRRDPDSDRKWQQLAQIMGGEILTDGNFNRRKFVIFTEHRDTLEYLVRRLRSLRGRHDAVVTIHGGMHREARKEAEEGFNFHPPRRRSCLAAICKSRL
jgi:superfamily II DNA/RNA helicase